MMEFFSELANRIRDHRRNDITIRQMLQMRAGYPWEEATAEGTDLLLNRPQVFDNMGTSPGESKNPISIWSPTLLHPCQENNS